MGTCRNPKDVEKEVLINMFLNLYTSVKETLETMKEDMGCIIKNIYIRHIKHRINLPNRQTLKLAKNIPFSQNIIPLIIKMLKLKIDVNVSAISSVIMEKEHIDNVINFLYDDTFTFDMYYLMKQILEKLSIDDLKSILNIIHYVIINHLTVPGHSCSFKKQHGSGKSKYIKLNVGVIHC